MTFVHVYVNNYCNNNESIHEVIDTSLYILY